MERIAVKLIEPAKVDVIVECRDPLHHFASTIKHVVGRGVEDHWRAVFGLVRLQFYFGL